MRELQCDVRLQLLGGDAGDDFAICLDDRLGLGRLEHAFAEQRRVRREALLVEAAQDCNALVERLTGDEACGAEAAAVPADEPLDAPAVGRGEDPLAEGRVRGAAQLCESSHSCTSPTRFCSSVRCPFTSSIHASAPGIRAASHSPCETRDESVVRAVHDQRRAVDVADVEAPRPGECEVVVDPAVGAGREPVGMSSWIQVASAPVSAARSSGPEERPEHLFQLIRAQREALVAVALDRRPERLLAGEHEVELLDVVLAHACVPVEALGAPRRDAGERGGCDQPVAAECRAGERMRAAAGDSPRSRTARGRARRRSPRCPGRRRRSHGRGRVWSRRSRPGRSRSGGCRASSSGRRGSRSPASRGGRTPGGRPGHLLRAVRATGRPRSRRWLPSRQLSSFRCGATPRASGATAPGSTATRR